MGAARRQGSQVYNMATLFERPGAWAVVVSV
jgi:hypothetical protein